MALDECLASIICYQTRAEQLLYGRACKVSMVHHEGYDREMNLLANLVSKRVCSLIHEQYMYAIGSALYTFYETTPGVISIKNDAENEDSLDELRVQYTINCSTWECSCLFMTTRLLPYRHIFFYVRRQLKREIIIPTQLLHPRWLLSSTKDTHSQPIVARFLSIVTTILPPPRSPWDVNPNFERQVALPPLSANL
ncbi:hypothetical protein PPTG_15999 [Phytophthora nicotianae INRA-310]|uniref:SWIM-type domain-containing protein n=1 Tax=Phytophthora nicotianae (strain INRA-310) TaxID=761204 RepID=W2PUE0_PHYN3|nr:hypothetical protein PPTG_15999 [Phytophthora nicotianae INRA-310]ETN03809.1 hypothetical protein PPTG_15999 [Phytophthora nicotianae INRA-310]